MTRVTFIFGKRRLEINAAQLFEENAMWNYEDISRLVLYQKWIAYRNSTGQYCYINMEKVQEVRYG